MRKAEDINKAMLVKVVWRLHTEPDKPWYTSSKQNIILISFVTLMRLHLQMGHTFGEAFVGLMICFLRGLAR